MKKDLSKEAKSIMAGTWNARGGRREVLTLTFLSPPPTPPTLPREGYFVYSASQSKQRISPHFSQPENN